MPDPHRPVYHFQPPKSYMNDPKLLYWNGEYHVFFQYAPGEEWHGHKCWAHTVSKDLIHWKMLPIALAPSPQGPDKDGCWTGSVIATPKYSLGRFHIIYTGVMPQVQCLASSDDLVHWRKYKGNPILSSSPYAKFGPCWRDPYIWKEKDEYKMIVGSAIRKPGTTPTSETSDPRGKGAILLYASKDLTSWEYKGSAYIDSHKYSYECECPQIFKTGSRHILIFSDHSGGPAVHYRLGRWKNNLFIKNALGILDGGASFYAAKVLEVPHSKRRILWGWLREERPESEAKKAGWSGALSLPRDVFISPEGYMGARPAKEIKKLRFTHIRVRKPEKDSFVLDMPITIDRAACEILITAKSKKAKILLRMYADTEGKGGLSISIDFSSKKLGRAMLLDPLEGKYSLRVYVDHSVIETCANEAVWSTRRFYPAKNERTIVVEKGGESIKRIDVWGLKSIK